MRWHHGWSITVLLAAACTETPPASGPGPEPALALVARAPRPERIDTPRDAIVVVEFSVPLDPAVLTGVTPPLRVLGRWSGLVSGTFALVADRRRLEFTPDRQFLAGDLVTVIVGPGLRTASGMTLGRSVTWSFLAAAGPGSLDLQAGATVPVRAPGEGRVQTYGAYPGDLNGDGFPDLVVPNELANDLRVFLNDGAGGYGGFTALSIPGASSPSTNEGSDFDFDGRIDFAVGSGGGSVLSVFDGVPGGGLQFGANYTAAAGVRGLCVLDLDGDGYLDLVTANRAGGVDGNVARFRNDRAGRFVPLGLVETGSNGETACATGDANEDGLQDVFIGAIGSGEIVVLLSDGAGGLVPGSRVSTAGGPWMVVSGDVDGDGHVDVVGANFSASTVAVVLGDGTGGLRLDATYPVGTSPIAVDIGDLDGDGDLDVISSNYGAGTWTILENDGAGAFGNPRTLSGSTAGSCSALNDRDGDGDLDLTGVDEVDDLLFLFTNGA